MLTKFKQIEHVQSFKIAGDKLIGIRGNQLLLLDENEVLLEFEKPVSRILVNTNTIYANDWSGQAKKITDGKIETLVHSAVYLTAEENYLSHLSPPFTAQRTAFVNAKGEVIWELNIKSMEFLIEKDLIIVRDRVNNKRVISARHLHSGEKKWDSAIADFGHFIGICDDDIIIANNEHSSIFSINKNNGFLKNLYSKDHLLAIQKQGINLEKIKIDHTNRKFVHPYGEIEMDNDDFQYRKRLLEKKMATVHAPSVFPFLFTGNLCIFGVQEDDNRTKKSICNLVVLDREKGKILFEESVNKERKGAGIKQIEWHHNQLYLLDSFDILSIYQLN